MAVWESPIVVGAAIELPGPAPPWVGGDSDTVRVGAKQNSVLLWVKPASLESRHAGARGVDSRVGPPGLFYPVQSRAEATGTAGASVFPWVLGAR